MPEQTYNPYAQPQGNARRAASKKKSRRKKKNRRGDPGKRIATCILAMLVCAIVGLFVRGNCFGIVRVNGDAMGATLQDGSYVLVLKNEFVKDDANPERDSVVAIQTDEGLLLRRVIGLPGETVSYNGMGDVAIDGETFRGSYIENAGYEIYPEMTLGTQRYYVLSDNRGDLTDSRDDRIGAVPKHKIVGRCVYVIWPLSKIGSVT